MRVTATHSKQIEVEIDDFTVREIIISKFCEVFDLRPDAYIKDGKLVVDVEYHTSHSWYDEKLLRDATEEDEAALKVLKKLKQDL